MVDKEQQHEAGGITPSLRGINFNPNFAFLPEVLFIGGIILVELLLISSMGAVTASITMSVLFLSTIILYSFCFFISNPSKYNKKFKKNLIRVITIFSLGYIAVSIENYKLSLGYSLFEYEFLEGILIYLGMSLLYASIAALGFSFYTVLISGVSVLFIHLVPMRLRQYLNFSVIDTLFLCWGGLLIFSIFRAIFK